jgi:protein-arginine kinase activator protein McsA
MKTKAIINLLLITTWVIICYACKKQDATNKTRSAPTIFHSVIQKWQQQTATVETASTKRQQKADSVLKNLDYSEAINIKLSGLSTLYLIKISQLSKTMNKRYLAVKENGDVYSLEGVYEAKDLQKIQQFYATQKIAGRDSILIWDINNRPIKGWKTGSDGKLKGRVASWHPSITASIRTNSIETKSIKLNLAPAPPPTDGVCIDWYWTVYDLNTQQVYSEIYIGSTGACGGAGGPSTPEMQSCQDEFSQQVSNFDNEKDGATEVDNSNTGFTVGESTEPMTKPWSSDWTCLNAPGGWSLISHEIGEVRRINWNAHPWAFNSITHNEITMNGSTLPGVAVSFSKGAGQCSVTTQTMANTDVTAAGMELKFSVTYTFVGNCPVVREVVGTIITPKTKNYIAHAVWGL